VLRTADGGDPARWGQANGQEVPRKRRRLPGRCCLRLPLSPPCRLRPELLRLGPRMQRGSPLRYDQPLPANVPKQSHCKPPDLMPSDIARCTVHRATLPSCALCAPCGSRHGRSATSCGTTSSSAGNGRRSPGRAMTRWRSTQTADCIRCGLRPRSSAGKVRRDSPAPISSMRRLNYYSY
jgi:hypothetical protein